MALTVVERVIKGGGFWGLADLHEYAAEMIVGADYKKTMTGPAGKFTTFRGPDDMWRIVGQYTKTKAGLYVNGTKL